MNARSEKIEGAAKRGDALRLELERSHRELDECQKRIKQMEGVFARVADAIFVAKPDEHNRGEASLSREKQVLEMIAKGNPLQFFDALCRLVEENDQLREDFRDLFEEAPIPYVHVN